MKISIRNYVLDPDASSLLDLKIYLHEKNISTNLISKLSEIGDINFDMLFRQ